MEARTASHRYNGAAFVGGGLHKDLNATPSYINGQHEVECNRQLQIEAQGELADIKLTAEECSVDLQPGTKIEQEEKPVGPPGRK